MKWNGLEYGCWDSKGWLRLLCWMTILPIAVGACEFFDSENSQHANIFGEGESKLQCSEAKRHPYPTIAGDTRKNPGGYGNVGHYGKLDGDYSGSAELIWIIEVGSGNLNVYLEHDPEDDLDLFLLGSCDENNIICASQRHEGGYQEQFNYVTNLGGIYYVVVDGVDGRFGDNNEAMLQIIVGSTQ